MSATFCAFAGSRAARALMLAAVAGAYLAVHAMRRPGIDERDERRARLGTEDA